MIADVECIHLENKIRIFEDMLLRSKNMHETEIIRGELVKMRKSLLILQQKKGGGIITYGKTSSVLSL